jgi:hypothetical protein
MYQIMTRVNRPIRVFSGYLQNTTAQVKAVLRGFRMAWLYATCRKSELIVLLTIEPSGITIFFHQGDLRRTD